MKKITIIKSISPKVCSESGHQPFRCGRPKLSAYPYKINMLPLLHIHYCSLKYTGSHRFLWVKTPVFCIAHDAIETLFSKSCLNQKLSLC
ncbi:hypothetical protein DTU39_07585 [Salmonella enterica subsp. enterica serovar Yolo]|nr:hypothetical protein [Salmonella enterica subsp. enterica serovar Yolo]